MIWSAALPRCVFRVGCRGRDAGCPAPPSQIPAGGIPAPGSSRWHVVFAHREVCPFDPSFLRPGLPVWASPTRRPLLQFRGCALPLDTMSRSDSRSARRRFLSLRRPSCLALVVSAAGTLRASSVPCVCFHARHALRPRQAFHALTFSGVSVLGSSKLTPSPLAFSSFEAVLLKQDATPACGSRLSRGTLLDGRSTRLNQRSTGSPSAKQPSVLGSWLDFSIHRFRSELRKPGFQT